MKHKIKFVGEYPPCWPLIKAGVRDECHDACERCGHPNDPKNGYTFTVHHLDNNKSNCLRWNLAGLCQRCHLHIQGVIEWNQSFMLDHSEWMKPHIQGFYEYLKENNTNEITQR